jgi:hypothetical protein
VRVEVAERGGEEQRGTVLRDHALHGLLHGLGLGHVFFAHDGDARHLLDLAGGFVVRLVVAEVILRPHIDHADRQRFLGQHELRQAAQGQAGTRRPDTLDPRPTIPLIHCHALLL